MIRQLAAGEAVCQGYDGFWSSWLAAFGFWLLGLIDVHVHVFEGVGPTGVNADQYCLGRGVTTAVDAGSAGYFSIAGFRQYVIRPSATRVYAMIDIGARGTLMGLVGNYSNLDWVNPQLTARAAEAF